MSLLLAAALLTGNLRTLDGSVVPKLVGNTWWNAPTTPEIGKGKVTILHFWTFACSNCQANQPIYKAWMTKYKGTDVQIVGIHTPEIERERNPDNVARYIKDQGLQYPVLFDPEFKNWDAWKQGYWPAVYLIDRKGRARYLWEGELRWQGATGDLQIERKVAELLKEKS